MSEQDTNTPETTETPPEEQSLEEQLAELKKKQEAAEVAEANYAGLEKLIEDTQKAEEGYAKLYDQLQGQENRLKTERNALSSALEAALGPTGVQEVKKTVNEEVGHVCVAEEARDDAKTAVDKAQSTADERAKDLAAAQAKLDMWRKPGDSIGKRLKIAEGLIEEIKKLRNAGGRGEAYWKLALGDLAGDEKCDPEQGKKFLMGQEFLDKVLTRQPEVIHPDHLRERIRTAWNEFRAARTESAKANAALATAQADLKQEEAVFADKSKNLIKTIAEALAKREAASDAA